jgi:hypothetical protein
MTDSLIVGSNHISLGVVEAVDCRSSERDPLWNGAAIGLAIMVPVSLTLSGYGDRSHTDRVNVREIAGGLIIGAAIGMMVDAARETTRWTALWRRQ